MGVDACAQASGRRVKGEARGSIVGTAGERALPGVVHGERSMRVAASSCRQHGRVGSGWSHVRGNQGFMLHALRAASTVSGAHGDAICT